jgi:hypothetical protein
LDRPLYFDRAHTSPAISRALEILGPEIDVHPVGDGGDDTLVVEFGGDGPAFEWDGVQLRISGAKIPHILRAIAVWRGFIRHGAPPARYAEAAHFDTLGVMVDASRNAVPTVSTIQYLLRRLALMGINQLMLYTEDTYEIEGHPYFGYLRGAYTAAEIREIDGYANDLGVEVVPCIQVLGHLRQVLQWSEYERVKDTDDVLLVGEQATYELVEQMIAAASGMVSSTRIHVGMDEAHGLGRGRYADLHGQRSRFELMNEHLHRVSKICERRGLEPMIWSDMYFRLGSPRGQYYDPETIIPPGVAEGIPTTVDLVYWDYYHVDSAFYEDWIARHRLLGKEPIVATGQWTWDIFWQHLGLTMATNAAAMAACKRMGVRRAITTIWGDDGAEVDLLSALPGIQYFADHGFQDEVNQASLRRTFWGSSRGEWDCWCVYSRIDEVPGCVALGGDYVCGIGGRRSTCKADDDSQWHGVNPSKLLLWQDPLIGAFDHHLQGMQIASHYEAVVAELTQATLHQPTGRRGMVVHQLARVLVDKAELGVRLLDAYRRRDLRALDELVNTVLPRLIDGVRHLHHVHRQLWHELYKPFGWEVLDRRYGGLIARLESVGDRVQPFIDGCVDHVDELAAARLPPPGPGPKGASLTAVRTDASSRPPRRDSCGDKWSPSRS